jgi:hypothetical protein
MWAESCMTFQQFILNNAYGHQTCGLTFAINCGAMSVVSVTDFKDTPEAHWNTALFGV